MVCCALCGPAFWGLACFAGLRSGRFLSAHGRFALLAICNRLFLRFKKPLSISTPICALYPKRHSLPFSSDAHSDLTARPGSLRKTGRQGSWNLQWYSSSEEVLCKQLFLKSAAQVCGEAQAAPDAAIEYTKERVQFGRRISQFQNTQFQLADMYAKTEAAKWLVYSAAMKKQNHEPYSMDAAMAKLVAAETASDVTRRCVQLFGGYGYTREYPVERMMRDAKITEIYEGTSEVQRMVISANLGVN